MALTVARLNGEPADPTSEGEAETLDRVFFALSDPVRRAILDRLDQESLLAAAAARLSATTTCTRSTCVSMVGASYEHRQPVKAGVPMGVV